MFTKGQKFTLAHKRKISEALSKRVITEETRKKLSLAQSTRIRKPFTEEAKRNISNSLRGNKSRKDIPHTEETKVKIRNSMNQYMSKHSGTFKDTNIERIVEKQLKKSKRVYVKQKILNNYCVDFFLPDLNVIIECDGCYWHACEQCNKTKFKYRRKLDAERSTELTNSGYHVIRLWEHDILKKDFDLYRLLDGCTGVGFN